MAAITAANCGAVMSYGDDEYTQRLQVKFSDLFETAVTVFPVATGSAANALAPGGTHLIEHCSSVVSIF